MVKGSVNSMQDERKHFLGNGIAQNIHISNASNVSRFVCDHNYLHRLLSHRNLVTVANEVGSHLQIAVRISHRLSLVYKPTISKNE